NGQYSYDGDWANDVPHGHGDLEDPKYIHENVVFHQGVCQMPFVDEGAPVASLADCMPINTRIGRQALEDAMSMVKPRVEVRCHGLPGRAPSFWGRSESRSIWATDF
ncbi:hypothetical protein FOZ63_006585, partial [Perkinsus olseni]